MVDTFSPAVAVKRLDKIDASDPERAHIEADLVLLGSVPVEVRDAYQRVVGRSEWWACA